MVSTSKELKPSRFDRRLVAPMVLGSVLNPVNSSIIAVSLVPIGHDLGAAPSQTVWLISALYLATAVGQPVVGRLVDLVGPRAVYLTGTALVGLAGVLGLVAPDLGWLVVARVVLGIGTCAGYPSSMDLIRREADRTGESSPAGILTVLAVANQTVAVIGPPLGGLLIGVWGWRSTFAVNIPLSVACLVLGWLRLPHDPGGRDDAARQGQACAGGSAGSAGRARSLAATLDLPGIILFAGALVTLLLWLMRLQTATPWLLVAAVLLGAGFVVVELRSGAPFVDLRVLRGNLPLALTYVRMMLSATVSYVVLYGFTQWLEDGRGLRPSVAGLVLLPMFATAIVVSTTTGRHPEIRGKLLVGGAVQVVATLLMLGLGAHSSVVVLVGVVLLLGVPQGLLSLANQNAVYHQAQADRIASSAGLLRTFMYLGAIVASSASGLFLGSSADTAGLHEIALFASGVALAMLVVTLVDRSLARTGTSAASRRQTADPAPAGDTTS
ncbi:MFS transporter [Pedococcus sp. NPDC057267]|uniref:MFS transporter n=1 Tax=Pedococcus sp. NPDC057267 TaxID=3346077 RepID=UPI003630335E